MIVALASLPQYKGKTFANSDFGSHTDFAEDDDEEIKEMIKLGRKRFGAYPPEDLYFLLFYNGCVLIDETFNFNHRRKKWVDLHIMF